MKRDQVDAVVEALRVPENRRELACALVRSTLTLRRALRVMHQHHGTGQGEPESIKAFDRAKLRLLKEA